MSRCRRGSETRARDARRAFAAPSTWLVPSESTSSFELHKCMIEDTCLSCTSSRPRSCAAKEDHFLSSDNHRLLSWRLWLFSIWIQKLFRSNMALLCLVGVEVESSGCTGTPNKWTNSRMAREAVCLTVLNFCVVCFYLPRVATCSAPTLSEHQFFHARHRFHPLDNSMACWGELWFIISGLRLPFWVEQTWETCECLAKLLLANMPIKSQ